MAALLLAVSLAAATESADAAAHYEWTLNEARRVDWGFYLRARFEAMPPPATAAEGRRRLEEYERLIREIERMRVVPPAPAGPWPPPPAKR